MTARHGERDAAVMGPSQAIETRPRRGGPLREVVRGASAFLSGIAVVVRSPRALGWALVPAAIAVGVGIVLSAIGVWGVVRLSGALVSDGGVLGTLARGLLDLLFGGVAVFASVVVALGVAQPLARVALERIATPLDAPVDPRARPLRPTSGLFDSLRIALTALGITLPAVGVLELVTLFAPEAAFLTEPIAFVISALGLAWELLDHPFSRRGLGVGERLRWMKESAFAVIGFAIAAQVFLLIPGIDLFLLPVGIAGATRLYRDGPRLGPRDGPAPGPPPK
ncbi:MAG: EI24 domain-containing protein [Polyangiaceae bacterium]